jgi:hypothetical protein
MLETGHPMRSFAILALLILSACSTVTAAQSTCLKSNDPFPNQVACIKSEMAKTPSFSNQASKDAYLDAADHLTAQVQLGRITDAQARLQLEKSWKDIQADDLRTRADQPRPFNTTPGMNDCVREPASPQCLGIR